MAHASGIEWETWIISRSNGPASNRRSEEHTSELQSQSNLVCRLLLEKKKKTKITIVPSSYSFSQPTRYRTTRTYTYSSLTRLLLELTILFSRPSCPLSHVTTSVTLTT